MKTFLKLLRATAMTANKIFLEVFLVFFNSNVEYIDSTI